MKRVMIVLVLSISAGLAGCGSSVGTCCTTCTSKSSGANLGTECYDNYTEDECKQKRDNRQTNLTTCTYEFD